MFVYIIVCSSVGLLSMITTPNRGFAGAGVKKVTVLCSWFSCDETPCTAHTAIPASKNSVFIFPSSPGDSSWNSRYYDALLGDLPFFSVTFVFRTQKPYFHLYLNIVYFCRINTIFYTRLSSRYHSFIVVIVTTRSTITASPSSTNPRDLTTRSFISSLNTFVYS